MNSLSALLPTAFAVVAVLLSVHYGPPVFRRIHRFFSYPAYGLTALCPHCLKALPSPSHPLCPACRTPVSGFAATDPILRVASVGALYRRGSTRLVGAGLAGAFVLVAMPLALSVLLFLEGMHALAVGSVLAGIPWLLVISKSRSPSSSSFSNRVA